MDFPHHQEEEDDDEEAGVEVEEVKEEEAAGSWGKTKLSLLVLCWFCVVLCCVVLCVFIVSMKVFHVVSCWHKACLSLLAVFDVIPQFARL